MIMISPIFQMETLRTREVRELVHGHTARKSRWQTWNPDHLQPELERVYNVFLEDVTYKGQNMK